MPRGKADSTAKVESDDLEHWLDETTPLPTLPTWSSISSAAANDGSFAGLAANADIGRLVEVAESIDKHLAAIEKLLEALTSETPQDQSAEKRPAKKRVTKKRTAKKRASKKRVSKKTASS